MPEQPALCLTCQAVVKAVVELDTTPETVSYNCPNGHVFFDTLEYYRQRSTGQYPNLEQRLHSDN